MHFHCSTIDDATQQRPFPSHCLRVKPSHEFPPSFQTCASCRVLHNVQRLSLQKLNADLRIDFDRIGTCFDIVNVQYWCVLLSCPVKSLSRRRDHGCCHVLELESPILARSCFGVKVRQLQECSRLERSVSRCHGFSVRSCLRLCRVSGLRGPTSLTELATHSLSELRLPAVCPQLSAIVAALAVEPPTAAVDSSQLAPWSCQPVSKYVARIPASTIPEDVTTSAHVYQRAPTKERTTTS